MPAIGIETGSTPRVPPGVGETGRLAAEDDREGAGQVGVGIASVAASTIAATGRIPFVHEPGQSRRRRADDDRQGEDRPERGPDRVRVERVGQRIGHDHRRRRRRRPPSAGRRPGCPASRRPRRRRRVATRPAGRRRPARDAASRRSPRRRRSARRTPPWRGPRRSPRSSSGGAGAARPTAIASAVRTSSEGDERGLDPDARIEGPEDLPGAVDDRQPGGFALAPIAEPDRGLDARVRQARDRLARPARHRVVGRSSADHAGCRAERQDRPARRRQRDVLGSRCRPAPSNASSEGVARGRRARGRSHGPSAGRRRRPPRRPRPRRAAPAGRVELPAVAVRAVAVARRVEDDPVVAAAPARLAPGERQGVVDDPADRPVGQAGQLGVAARPGDGRTRPIDMRRPGPRPAARASVVAPVEANRWRTSGVARPPRPRRGATARSAHAPETSRPGPRTPAAARASPRRASIVHGDRSRPRPAASPDRTGDRPPPRLRARRAPRLGRARRRPVDDARAEPLQATPVAAIEQGMRRCRHGWTGEGTAIRERR